MVTNIVTSIIIFKQNNIALKVERLVLLDINSTVAFSGTVGGGFIFPLPVYFYVRQFDSSNFRVLTGHPISITDNQ